MAANRESSVEESEWAGISESGDDDMDFEVRSFGRFFAYVAWLGGKSWEVETEV